MDFADMFSGSIVLLGSEKTISDYLKKIFCYAVVWVWYTVYEKDLSL